MDLMQLPRQILSETLGVLDVQDVINFGECSKATRSLVVGDEYYWKQRCSTYGVSSLEGWRVDSFKLLYSSLLHPYRGVLGLWHSTCFPVGSLVAVELDAPMMICYLLSATNMNHGLFKSILFSLEVQADGQVVHSSTSNEYCLMMGIFSF